MKALIQTIFIMMILTSARGHTADPFSFECLKRLSFPTYLQDVVFSWEERKLAFEQFTIETGQGMAFIRLPQHLTNEIWLDQMMNSELTSHSLLTGKFSSTDYWQGNFSDVLKHLTARLKQLEQILTTDLGSTLQPPETDNIIPLYFRMGKSSGTVPQENNLWHPDVNSYISFVLNLLGKGADIFLGTANSPEDLEAQLLLNPKLMFELPPGWIFVTNGIKRQRIVRYFRKLWIEKRSIAA